MRILVLPAGISPEIADATLAVLEHAGAHGQPGLALEHDVARAFGRAGAASLG